MERRLFISRPRLRGMTVLGALLLEVSAAQAEVGWKCHAIDPADAVRHRTGADGVKLGDLNCDGRPDLVTGWEEGGQVRVCLHPGLETVKEPWPAITIGRVPSPEDAVFADLDSDGRLDVVSACEGKERKLHIHWAPPDVTVETAWITTTFSAPGLARWWMQILPHDVDRDGHLDLIVGSKNSGASVTWFRNPGGGSARDLSKWEVTLLAGAGWIMSLELLEGNFLIYSDRKGEGSGIWIAAMLDNAPWIAQPKRIAAADEEVMFLDLADVDGDGLDDLIVTIREATIRIHSRRSDPTESWEKVTELDPLPWDRFGTVKAVGYADLDGDGTGEFVITCENAKEQRCGVLIGSPDARGTRWSAIGGPEGVKFDRIELIDLDEDGDLDLLTCEERDGLGVVWYENPVEQVKSLNSDGTKRN